MAIIDEALTTGGDPNISDAFTINGQPGDLYNCSSDSTYRLLVESGKTYLLRIVNAVMNEEMFFGIGEHNLTVVGMDGAYLKPINVEYIMITPGQTMDVLFTANQSPSYYYMAGSPFADTNAPFDNTTTTGIVQYSGNYTPPSSPSFPSLPAYNDKAAAENYTALLQSLASNEHPINVPLNITTSMYITVSVNQIDCNGSCAGPDGNRLAASLNNISFQTPTTDILEAYYQTLPNVFTKDFPDEPPYYFNFTGDVGNNTIFPSLGTKVRVIDYNEAVEIVFQGTNVGAAENHPMHLHGYSFYVLGFGSGNFNSTTDPLSYNLDDPPLVNTIGVPKNGWLTIRFIADNPDTFKLMVEKGKTYLLRLVNAAMQELMFFSVAKHKLTVVGTDGAYTKPLTRDVITISPGQTIDVLLEANQKPDHYYMASRVYASAVGVAYDNTTTTALVEYAGDYTPTSPPPLPALPYYNDTSASVNFTGSLRSLASKKYPVNVPKKITHRFVYTISVNSFPCPQNSCAGSNGGRLAASVNNISFVSPSIDILQAYYQGINGVFGARLPDFPKYIFNFTGDNLPAYLDTPKKGTEVKFLEYNSTVELVFQGTNILAGTDHPMHLHGYSFYVVGWGLGNFDPKKDPANFNLIDPPLQNTIAVPKNGWSAIRFRAKNPGVWFMHCHIERHLSWGMDTAFIVKNGGPPNTHLLPPPPDMPRC
ncbi:hypothetical protein CDL15_Pgr027415 [Punica granatum]|uniref:laccase n=2 Tax=Punica granatum TaxID=22663 RepID=A0A218XIJ2_PUNGR|nr:hypothetical protein CDL15_Pgr027415 [Punica granatum]